jgi:hypothetical protein
MKWLAAVFSCLLTVSAFAEESNVQRMPTVNECAEWKVVNRLLMEGYSETPFVIADGVLSVITPEKISKAKHRLLIYLNQETTTFTIVSFFVEDDTACVLSSGNNFRPLVIPNGTDL